MTVAGTLALTLWTATSCTTTPTASAPPPYAAWPRDAVFYHLYVRSFVDSDGDGKGDLPGLTSKLGYIASLGVDGVLLLPVQQNAAAYESYGGYATTDYNHVDADYGTDADWTTFVNAAHAQGLKVILDLSLVEVAASHPWFVAAQASASAAERRHFLLTASPCPATPLNVFGSPGWNPLDAATCFYATYGPTVPNLNVRDAATADALRVVGTGWIQRGADGYRLDSAPWIAAVDPANPSVQNLDSPASHSFWQSFMFAIKGANSQSFAVAEVFDTDPAHLASYQADGIDMAFDYPLWLNGLTAAWSSGQKSALSAAVSASVAARPAGAMNGLFLDNHDVPGTRFAPYGRIADLLGNDSLRLRSAALLLFSLPGVPFVYYGDEIGLTGAPATTAGGPSWSRNPMQWDLTPGRGFTTGVPWAPFTAGTANVAAQSGQPGSLLETYRGLIAVRKSSPALKHGSYQEIATTAAAIYAFLRSDPAERVLVAVNLGASTTSTTLDLASAGITQATVTDRIFGFPYPAVTPSNASAYPLTLPAHAGVWLKLQ